MSREIIIDAKNQSLGRVASGAAKALIGKHKASFERHILSQDMVHVTNLSQLHLPEKKTKTKVYRRYTGYPGGLREEKLGDLIGRRGIEEALRRAVWGMLPKNKLRSRMIKNLKITR